MKLMKTTRSEGEFLTRFNTGCKMTKSKTPQFVTILVPDEQAQIMQRIGINDFIAGDSVEDVMTSVKVYKLDPANVPQDANKVSCAKNQTVVTVSNGQDENQFKIYAPLDKMVKFNSTNPNQGEHYWIGIAVQTGEASITSLKWNGTQLTSLDVADANSVNLPAGSIILWLPGETTGTASAVVSKGDKSTVLVFEFIH